MRQPSARLDLDSGPGRILRLEFHRRGDRYGHVVRLVTRDHSLPLLWSCDGPSDAAWPQSPPLQELQACEDGPHATLMLLGQSGAGHWSLCVHRESGRAGFLFDVACRARCQPERLGSRYHADANSHAQAVPRSQTSRTRAAEPCGPAWQLTAAGSGFAEPRIRQTDARIDVDPPLPAGPFPQTVRWKYRIELLPGAAEPS